MDDDDLKHSVLEKHVVAMDDKQKTSVRFYSYYSNDTLIYYELEFLIKLFKFSNEAAMIKSIPESWVRTVASFKDKVFHTATQSFDPEALFVESSGIAYLISRCENKTLQSTVTNLYNICIRKSESDRVKRINNKVVALQHSVKKLTREFETVKSDHHAHVGHTSAKHSLIKDTMQLIVENHESFKGAFDALLKKL